MPKEGISIYFTMKDGASQVLSSIGDKTKALDKDTQSLAQAYASLQKANEPLIRKQTELKALIEAQNKTVVEARKAYKEYGDEMSGLKMQLAIEEQTALKESLKDVEAQLKNNRKTYSEYQETLRKSAVDDGASGTSLTSLAKGLATGQVGQMVADSLGSALSSELASAIGLPAAAAISNTLSSTISGVAAGAVAGLPGMIAGGVFGALSGALSGATEIKEAQDDAFKEYYAGLYDDVNANTEDMISSGSTIAGSREQTRKAFVKRLGGEEEADEYLDKVQTMAGRTNYNYDEITGYSKQLLNTYAPEEVFAVLQSLSDATAGLSLSSSDVEVMISGLSRMRTTGKTTSEYLNYFSERGVDVYTALANALGVDKSGIAEMVSDGEIGGEFAAQAILDHIDQEYGGLSEDLMNTYDAMTANLEDIMTTIEAAGGEGYNETRKSGLQAEAEAYSGALGEAMEEINRIAGENKAYLENLSEQYTREALSAVLMGEKTTVFSEEDQAKLDAMAAAYEEASTEYAAGNQESGLKMERLKEEAETLATAAYESSKQYQTYMDEQLTQIAEIRDNTASMAATLNEYRLSQEQSKGIAATADYVSPLEKAANFLDWDTLYNNVLGGSSSFAYGLDRVPYDDYPVLLHEGERVKTAAEARAEDAGATGTVIQVSVTGNNFYGGTEELADQVAERVAGKLEAAAILAVPH